MGDEVSYVIRGTVSQVAHKTVQGKVTRVHTVEATAIAQLPENIADGLIEQAADRLSRLRDEKSGQTRLEDGPTHQVRPDGTVATLAADTDDPFGESFGKFDGMELPAEVAETGGWGDAHG